MANKDDIFAPPTTEELAKVGPSAGGDVFAPPSKMELSKISAGGGKTSEPESSALEALLGGGINSLTSGLTNKALAGTQAVGDSAAGKGDLEALYKKYLSQRQDNEEKLKSEHPTAYKVGDIAGDIGQGAAAFGLAGPLGLAGKMSAGAGLGAANTYLRAEKPDELSGSDYAKGAALGAGGALVGEGIAKVVGSGANALTNYLSTKTAPKQLAAALLNASEGNTLFTQGGEEAVEQAGRNLSAKAAQDFTRPISEKNQAFTQAFTQASDNGATVNPNPQMLQSAQQFVQAASGENLRIPSDVSSALQAMQDGTLRPDQANRAIQQIKAIMYDNPSAGPLKNATANIVSDLTSATNESLDSTTLQELNVNKAGAWQATEGLIQKANKFVGESDQQGRSASSYSPNMIREKIDSYINNLIDRSGSGSEQGVKARTDVSELNKYLTQLQQDTPLGIKNDDILKQVQNLGYLKSASKNVTGIRGDQGSIPALNSVVQKVVSSPTRIAEKLSGFEGLQNVSKRILGLAPDETINVQNATNSLLKGNQETMDAVSKKLSENPATAHLGLELSNPQKRNVNATIFSIMQNPVAKQQLGISEESAIANNKHNP